MYVFVVLNIFYVSLVQWNLETYPCFADVFNLTTDLSVLSAVMKYSRHRQIDPWIGSFIKHLTYPLFYNSFNFPIRFIILLYVTGFKCKWLYKRHTCSHLFTLLHDLHIKDITHVYQGSVLHQHTFFISVYLLNVSRCMNITAAIL